MKCFGLFVRQRTERRHPMSNNGALVVAYGNGPLLCFLMPARVLFTFNLEKPTMKQFKRISALVLALVFASALGCAGSPTQESTGEYITDSWITSKVKLALADDQQVKAREVNVETFKGVVQLSGFVISQAAMDQAVYVASGIKGVTSVKNDMRIK